MLKKIVGVDVGYRNLAWVALRVPGGENKSNGIPFFILDTWQQIDLGAYTNQSDMLMKLVSRIIESRILVDADVLRIESQVCGYMKTSYVQHGIGQAIGALAYVISPKINVVYEHSLRKFQAFKKIKDYPFFVTRTIKGPKRRTMIKMNSMHLARRSIEECQYDEERRVSPERFFIHDNPLDNEHLADALGQALLGALDY